MLKAAAACTARCGRISMVAFYDKPVDGLDLDGLIKRRISLISAAGCKGKMSIVARLMACGRLDLSPLITHRFPIEQAMEALEFIESGDPTCVKAMLCRE